MFAPLPRSHPPHPTPTPSLPRRPAELTRAVARAWVPWLPALGTNLEQPTLELLRRHAAQVLVPSSFHKASLVQLLGLPPSRVAVLPQPAAAADVCPPHFQAAASADDRRALQRVLGQQAGALRTFVFLHQAPAAWQYWAQLALEAFAAGWSASDDASLVLSLLPPAAEDEEAPGASWGLFLEDVQRRVEALQAQPGAPHVVLATRLPRLGRWEERLLQAADVAVLPFLGGTAGRELLLAASCARAVVTTAGGPAADMLASNSSAWLVPAQPVPCRVGEAAGGARVQLGCLEVRPGDLAAAMRQAWLDPGGRQQRSAAAREAAQRWVRDAAGWDAVAARLWRHVHGLLPALPAAQAA